MKLRMHFGKIEGFLYDNGKAKTTHRAGFIPAFFLPKKWHFLPIFLIYHFKKSLE